MGFGADGAAQAAQGWSNPNLLINWDFRRPVNRRGKTEYAGVGYTIDRWMLSGNASNPLYNVETRVLSCTPTTTQFVILEQRIEDPSRLAGKTVTFSVLLESAERAIIQIWRTRGTETIVLGVSGGWVNDLFKKIAVDITEDLLDSDLLRIIIQTQNCITPIAAKLELGPHQTLAHQDADGNWVLNDPPDYDLQYALCSLYSPITGEWIGNQHSNLNLLDNWYFADPENQRGQAEYTAFNATQSASTYTIDRFKISATAGCSITCKVEDNGVTLAVTPPAGKSGQANFFQILAPNVLPPGVYTLSWLYSSDCLVRPFVFNGQVLSGYMDFPASDTPAVASIQLKITEEMQKRNTIFYMQINSSVEAHVKLYAAKVELGPQQTLAHQDADGNWVLNDPPPNKALELAKCQHYYCVMNAARNPVAGFGMGSVNSNEKFVYIPVSVPSLRTYPAVRKEGDMRLINNRTGGVVDAVSIVVYRNSIGSPLMVQIPIPEGTNWASGDSCELVANNDANARLIFDANL